MYFLFVKVGVKLCSHCFVRIAKGLGRDTRVVVSAIVVCDKSLCDTKELAAILSLRKFLLPTIYERKLCSDRIRLLR